MEPTADLAKTVVSRYFELVNSDRFDDLAEIFAADIVLEMCGASPRTGCEAAIAYYPRALAALPHHIDDPVVITTGADGTRAVAEIAFTGTTTNGTDVEFTAVDLFDLDHEGKIARLRSFYDTAGVGRMIAGST